ncbi:MAG: 23S rRNA (adenine(2503)-C(2))-methyltransferase RlmN [Verrucomicrobia bacterium]|nr:23S rRNA (adenine(2503)-C(2))-methyltransferase RlmN [Verrucomicrobiota bacterium]MDE3098170.1 23S rRNA (adenine(2503)-C(2))-methyltransferase RlmN [Verrucomicrobiota bacterium]
MFVKDIQSLTRGELEGRLTALGQPAYRAAQTLDWLYVRRVTTWDAMTNLPRALRGLLQEQFSLHAPELVRRRGSRDSTQKFLWRLADQSLIESVLIPANRALYGEASDRHTLCISTQVGCAYGCRFCASGLEGWKRNLEPDEIVGQVLAVERVVANEISDGESGASERQARRIVDNVVVMGMGEPLANYDRLLQALKILNAPWGLGIGARKITVSTSGLAPQIRRLAAEPLQFRLAISLHGATDDVRNRLMPVNRKYPLRDLMAACEEYRNKGGRRITFEYILIEGVNDDISQVRPLATLARRLGAKVNLIPYNTVEGLRWKRPAESVCETFLHALEKHGVVATLRREKGHDIDAACGQLRLKAGNLAAAPAAQNNA